MSGRVGSLWIEPDWALPAGVRAVMTTRRGGASRAPYDSLNLGLHVGDRPEFVLANRAALAQSLALASIAWLDQVHAADVVDIDAEGSERVHRADASVTSRAGVALAIMVADCLPVLMARRDGSRVGGAHAGWRGLANGVVLRALEAMSARPAEVTCWLGPAIAPKHYEVDEGVRASFDAAFAHCFTQSRPGHYRMDLAGIAEAQLRSAGVLEVVRSGECVFTARDQWFSHRRDRVTGRCAALIWREGSLREGLGS
jgi:YfiH family protein